MPPHERRNNSVDEDDVRSNDDPDDGVVMVEEASIIASHMRKDAAEKQQRQERIIEHNTPSSSNGKSYTRFHSSPNAAPFVECTTPHGFTNPFLACSTTTTTTTTVHRTPAEVNAHDLNLYLGQRWITTDHTPEWHDAVAAIHRWCYHWWETPWLFCLRRYNILLDCVLRFVLITVGWKMVYYPLHKWWLGRRTGLHPSVSLECHALSTVMFLGHFVLHSVQRIRFGLSILTAARPEPPRNRVEDLSENRGLFVHATNNAATTTTLMWFHAGAYLSGCPHGNVGVADAISTQTNCHVFLPTYRLAPEHSMADIMEDVMNAYHWIRKERPHDTLMVGGWSAGAALAMRLLQEVSRIENKHDLDASSSSSFPIAAVVLCSPFCRYALPSPDSSMIQYAKHDWLVTQGVSRVSFDTLQLDTFWGGDPEIHSPLEERNLRHLRASASAKKKKHIPLLVVVSEHEAVYDETCALVRLVRQTTDLPVTVAQWRYMPHGWYMFDGLMPEGAQTVRYICDWMKTNVMLQKKCN